VERRGTEPASGVKHVVTSLNCVPTQQLKILKVLKMNSTEGHKYSS